jgi:hypothetical protein
MLDICWRAEIELCTKWIVMMIDDCHELHGVYLVAVCFVCRLLGVDKLVHVVVVVVGGGGGSSGVVVVVVVRVVVVVVGGGRVVVVYDVLYECCQIVMQT